MPIPFRDAEHIESLGAAAFLTLQRQPDAWHVRGAMLLINARGEPLEFVHCRSEASYSMLWRRDDIIRQLTKELTKTLFAGCTTTPRILLCAAGEIQPRLIVDELSVSIPVCFVASADTPVWLPDQPSDTSEGWRLFNELARRDLVLEPFQRARGALGIVYPDDHTT
jgi:hypothetical protein